MRTARGAAWVEAERLPVHDAGDDAVALTEDVVAEMKCMLRAGRSTLRWCHQLLQQHAAGPVLLPQPVCAGALQQPAAGALLHCPAAIEPAALLLLVASFVLGLALNVWQKHWKLSCTKLLSQCWILQLIQHGRGGHDLLLRLYAVVSACRLPGLAAVLMPLVGATASITHPLADASASRLWIQASKSTYPVHDHSGEAFAVMA